MLIVCNTYGRGKNVCPHSTVQKLAPRMYRNYKHAKYECVYTTFSHIWSGMRPYELPQWTDAHKNLTMPIFNAKSDSIFSVDWICTSTYPVISPRGINHNLFRRYNTKTCIYVWSRDSFPSLLPKSSPAMGMYVHVCICADVVLSCNKSK